MTPRHWIPVIKSTFIHAAGNSLRNPWLSHGNVWQLELADGRTIIYPVRYRPDASQRRGWTHRRDSEDALPAPRRILRHP